MTGQHIDIEAVTGRPEGLSEANRPLDIQADVC